MGFYEYGEIFVNLLSMLVVDMSSLSFVSTAPEDVEINVFDCENEMTVNAILVNEKAVAPIVAPFEIKIKTTEKPKAVTLLPSGEKLDFKFENGYTTFKTRELKIFDMYRIEK